MAGKMTVSISKPIKNLRSLAIFLVLTSCISAEAQQSGESLVTAVQRDLMQIVELESRQFDIDCRKIFERSFFTDSDIKSKITDYLECFLEKLDILSSRWGDRSERLLQTAEERLLNTFDIEVGDLESREIHLKLAGVLASTYAGMVNWNKSSASLLKGLNSAGFFDEQDVKEFMSDLQEGLNRATSVARGLSEDLSKGTLEYEDLRQRINVVSNAFFSTPRKFIEGIRGKLRIAGRRQPDRLTLLFRQYDHPNDMERIYKAFDGMMAGVYDAFLSSSRIAWADLRSDT
jgi:hypothetical protein